VGRVPEEVLKADTSALAAGRDLPYAKVALVANDPSERPNAALPVRSASPLDHS
jgi:hypothetical protein